ncbi:MAG: hypothetical protein ACYS4W_05675 [Planctomycetota bacterium]|jgi:hypothetical protein
MKAENDDWIKQIPRDNSNQILIPKVRLYERLLYARANLRGWLHVQWHRRPLIIAAKTLKKKNPEVMPDTIKIRTWIRLYLPVTVTVRMMSPSDKISRSVIELLDKRRWAFESDGRTETVYMSRNLNTYKIYIVSPA